MSVGPAGGVWSFAGRLGGVWGGEQLLLNGGLAARRFCPSAARARQDEVQSKPIES
jgi:hypothetical protein